ncbi:hypothetical protein, partial [Paracoccus sphaerophysae]|uniref:hypothetical protein n=1 Tax=Paracoccus sphaerophysae TaxID=690417 RepID=UPI0023529CB0
MTGLRAQGADLDAAVKIGAQMRQCSVCFRVRVLSGVIVPPCVSCSLGGIVAVSEQNDPVAEPRDGSPGDHGKLAIETFGDRSIVWLDRLGDPRAVDHREQEVKGTRRISGRSASSRRARSDS